MKPLLYSLDPELLTVQKGHFLLLLADEGWLAHGRGTTRAEDAQGTPTQSHISPSILVYEDILLVQEGHYLLLLADGSLMAYRGTSPMRNSPPPLGPPYGPRHRPTVGSWGGAVSYERGAPVNPNTGYPADAGGALPAAACGREPDGVWRQLLLLLYSRYRS